MRRLVAGAAVLLIAAVGAATVTRSTFDPPAGVPALGERIERVVPRSLAEHDVPGASIAVVRQGRVAWARGFGVADVRTGAPVTPGTRFQVASVSKPVAALAVLRLANELGVDPDAALVGRLGALRPRSRGPDPRGVTLARLLSHTAGLSVPGYSGLPPDRPLPWTLASLEGRSGDAGPVELAREPGSDVVYSGGGYTVAQHWAETAGGEDFAAIARERVLRPLRMKRSSFAQEDLPGDATGHTAGARPMPAYRYPELAAAGLRATAPDLARFAAAFLPGPDRQPPGAGVIPYTIVDAMTRPAPATGGSRGLGFRLESLDDGTRIVRHSGSNRGWRSDLVILPGEDWAIAVLTNGDGGDAVAADIVGALLG